LKRGGGVKSKNEPSLRFWFFIAKTIYMRTLFGLSVNYVDYPWIRLTILESSLNHLRLLIGHWSDADRVLILIIKKIRMNWLNKKKKTILFGIISWLSQDFLNGRSVDDWKGVGGQIKKWTPFRDRYFTPWRWPLPYISIFYCPNHLYADPIWIIRGLSRLSLDKIDNPCIILGSSSVADRALIGCRLGADPDNPRSALE
jgi:hypothetical protein